MISVCIATYNGEKYIKEQLDSILKQLSIEDEVIISDDGSSDDTINLISSFSDPRIKLIHNDVKIFKHSNQSKSYQVTKNFENALIYATGDYIFLSDQDDVWEENKVRDCILLMKNKDINLIVHDACVVDQFNTIISESYFEDLNSQKGFLRNIIKNSYLGCCMVFDRNILLRSLPFPENLIAHDMWIGLIAEKNGSVAFVEQNYIRYRRHNSTVTPSGMKSNNSLNFKISYRFQFIIQYIGSFVKRSKLSQES